MSEPGMTHEVRLRSGLLTVQVEHADLPLEILCGFGSRRSRKRGFVFVSKVLGKHWPVRPSLFQDCCNRLAGKLEHLPGPVVIVGMAETATGLGQGVFESLLRATGRDDLLFVQGTRYVLDDARALRFEEAHSHATRHFLYEPRGVENRRLFAAARTLVIIDDELSTGATAVGLARAYREINPSLKQVVAVCLTDWLGRTGRASASAKMPVAAEFVSLLQGEYRFEPAGDFDPGPPPNVVGDEAAKNRYLPPDCSRRGVREVLDIPADSLVKTAEILRGERLLVLGTGEFHYPPFRLALWLEQQGWDVRYQSTTRSPLLVDGDLRSVLEFVDNYHEAIPNYLYNVADRVANRAYDRIVIGYETTPLPAAHQLPQRLGAVPVWF